MSRKHLILTIFCPLKLFLPILGIDKSSKMLIWRFIKEIYKVNSPSRFRKFKTKILEIKIFSQIILNREIESL